MRVRAGPQADLAALALGDRILVLVEDLHVPARHRPAHRALAHLHEREVRAQRIGLGQPVVVEHRDPVLLAEPADRLRVERLAGAADDPELLRVALAGVLDRHHRSHRGRGREDVRDLVAGQEVELLTGVEAALALVDALERAEPPGPEQRADPGSPGPFAHPVEGVDVVAAVRASSTGDRSRAQRHTRSGSAIPGKIISTDHQRRRRARVLQLPPKYECRQACAVAGPAQSARSTARCRTGPSGRDVRAMSPDVRSRPTPRPRRGRCR